MNISDFPQLSRYLDQLDTGTFLVDEAPTLYHATRLSNLGSILTHGLMPRYCGAIHGSMAIRPTSPTVYLSRHSNSNNLNSALFRDDQRVIILAIDSRHILEETLYPDDALFVGFGQEDVFADASEIAETFSIPLNEAEHFLDVLTDLEDNRLPDAMRPLWRWYLKEHGEISTTETVPSGAIMSARDYQTGKEIDLGPFRERIQGGSLAAPLGVTDGECVSGPR